MNIQKLLKELCLDTHQGYIIFNSIFIQYLIMDSFVQFSPHGENSVLVVCHKEGELPINYVVFDNLDMGEIKELIYNYVSPF